MGRLSIVIDVPREEERLLIDAARRLGHGVEVVNVLNTLNWIGPDSQDLRFDVAFIRCISHSRALAIASYLEYLDVPTVNSSHVIWRTGDKLLTTLALSKKGIRIPRTVVAYSRRAALQAANELGYPVVVKPLIGSWGRFVMKAPDSDSLDDILELKEHLENSTFKIHYLQKYVEKPGRDIRAFYLWGEIPVAIYRVSESWKTNTARGAKAVATELSEEALDLAIRAGDAVGGGVLGVDLMEDKDGTLYVSEVNGIVEFRNTVRVSSVDLPRLIIETTLRALRR